MRGAARACATVEALGPGVVHVVAPYYDGLGQGEGQGKGRPVWRCGTTMGGWKAIEVGIGF